MAILPIKVIAVIVKNVEKVNEMMTERDNQIFSAARKFSSKCEQRMAFSCGARWADEHLNCINFGYLQNWYQDSVDETKEPIWTDKHLEELFGDFYLMPKINVEFTKHNDNIK